MHPFKFVMWRMPTAIISGEEMRSWESASWGAGKSQREVIENVGRFVAERALALTSENDRILILAGKGHNGDDGRAAVGHLLNRKVKLVEVSDPKSASQEISRLLEKHPALIIDALFGIGLSRALSTDWIQLIEIVNGRKVLTLSVDVPSGLNADTGKPEGAAIQADITLTVGSVKRGLLAEAASPYVGRLELASEIGLIPCPITPEQAELVWISAEDFHRFPPRRIVSGHKGSFGHLAIFAGSVGYHGAAVLAARGAQRAQPGLITLVTQKDCYTPIASQLQSVMVHPWPPKIHVNEICSAMLIGPGLASVSDDIQIQAREYWTTLQKPLIIDASALDWLQPGPTPPGALRVITPHPGEAARMLKCESKTIQADRFGALRTLSSQFGNCWVILKGHQTLIGRVNGPISVNSSGNPHLAQGGSGDLLAGFITGLVAQPALQKNPEQTLRYSVWAHGAAADRLTQTRPGWTIEDLAAELR
jgi:ADP-dependent NAD(P)H-hydrate dehydratase / NAD(P)H-hydrate epimerase